MGASKLQVGIKAGARSVLPVVIAVLGLVESGAIKHPRDLLAPGNMLALASAAGLKGIVSGLTAKDVTVAS